MAVRFPVRLSPLTAVPRCPLRPWLLTVALLSLARLWPSYLRQIATHWHGRKIQGFFLPSRASIGHP
jgi:hypothetical protein